MQSNPAHLSVIYEAYGKHSAWSQQSRGNSIVGLIQGTQEKRAFAEGMRFRLAGKMAIIQFMGQELWNLITSRTMLRSLHKQGRM